jgi:hypothetical protein
VSTFLRFHIRSALATQPDLGSFSHFFAGAFGLFCEKNCQNAQNRFCLASKQKGPVMPLLVHSCHDVVNFVF